MAETLGSLCDKLTIVKLKQWHSTDSRRLETLAVQQQQLAEEIDEYLAGAVSGRIPPAKLTFAANKVYPKQGNPVRDFSASIGPLIGELAKVNCDIWHEQEKVYQFDQVPAAEKDGVIKQLAILNLERVACAEAIDKELHRLVTRRPD